MLVKGGREVTLTPGQTFYENPGDVHTVGKNASQTAPAKFLAFFVKDHGAPPTVPVPELVRTGQFLNQARHETLRIPEQHQRIRRVIKFVINPREPGRHTALDNHHGT